MSSPSHTAIELAPKKAVSRSRKAAQFSVALFAVIGIAFTTTACTPEVVARQAIEKHWGKNAACAERIVKRESNYDADAVNRSSGATGLFQMMPLHKTWIKAELGYNFSEMVDPVKNSEAAKRLADKNYKAYGDMWAPWRTTGRAIKGGGCPA